jgi:excisionase family DNA binding protein
MEHTYLTLNEACELLRISKSKMYKMTSSKSIPHKKIGKLLRFKPAELIDFVEKGFQMSESIEMNPLELLRIPSIAA